MKKITLFILLSFFIIAVYGCSNKSESEYNDSSTANKAYHVNFDKHVYKYTEQDGHIIKNTQWEITLSLDVDKERFIFEYETNADSSYFYSCFFDIDPFGKLSMDYKEIYSQLELKTSYGVEIPYDEENGINYEFPGSYTIYISYANACDEIKNYLNNGNIIIQCYSAFWIIDDNSRMKSL